MKRKLPLWLLLLASWPCAAVRGEENSIRTVVEFMASLGSRLSGYPGGDRAAAFVEAEFARLGLEEITREEYPVTLPIEGGGELLLEETGERFAVYGLWPNMVRTPTLPPAGEALPMIYGGRGDFTEFEGRELAGRAVLMEFNSWNRWLNAASLGARAIVFIAPENTTSAQADGKYSQAPLDVPRLWIGRRAGASLRRRLREGGEVRVRLHSRMDWEERRAANIWGLVPGRDPELKDQTIIVEAYYDGMSVVPALAPAAEQAGSIAVLLELARHLRAHPPARSVVLAATGAHFLDQRGIVDFLDRHARLHPYYAARMEKPFHPRLFISLDLSSRTDQLGIWNNTYSYDLKRFFVPFGRRFTHYAREIAPGLGRRSEKALVNGISPIKGMDWASFVPGGLELNSVKALRAGLVSLAFVTVNDARFGVDTPLDLPGRVNYANLERQSRFLEGLFDAAFSDPEFFAGLEDFAPVLEDQLRSLRVKVRAFPRRSQVPDKAVPGALVVLGWGRSHKGVRLARYGLADAEGDVDFPGLFLGGIPVAAYALDPESGAVVYAPDLSERAQQFHGSPANGWQLHKAIRWTTQDKMIVVFPCVSSPFYSLIDPHLLGPLSSVRIIDRNGVPLRQFGLARGFGVDEPVAVAFGARDETEQQSIKVLMGELLLLNSPGGQSEESARGEGYVLGRDSLLPTEFLAARDMWRLNEARLHTMRRHAIENQRLARLHEQGGRLLEKAARAMEAKQWKSYTAYVRAALGVISRAYPEVLGTLNDVIKGIVFFLALVIPTAFFAERLLFAAADIRRQLAGFGALLLIVWMVISQIHPAFSIAQPLVVLLAFAIMAMSVFVLCLIGGRFNRYVKEYQARGAHVHETDISRVSASYAAFMLGISNMRRRKLRTGLTLLTLTLLTFTVLSFTSFKQQVRFMAFSMRHAGRYEGALIRDRGWNRLSAPTLSYARSQFEGEGVVAPRSWYIAFDKEQKKYIEITRASQVARATGLLGLTPQEARITGVDQALRAGTFFARSDESSCLLSEEMAAMLGIEAGGVGRVRVRVFGREWTVRGLFEARRFKAIHDLDDEPLTPADFQLSSAQTLGPQATVRMSIEEESLFEIRPFVHLEPENVVIFPYEALRSAGATLRSVAVRFNEGAAGQTLVEDFLLRLAITVFAGLREAGEETIKVFSYTSVGMTAVEGLGALLIPMFIAALIVLNAMLGAVYERFREIGVYSSVGLAPMHIALLFVAEACVYAVMGVTLGYILGQGMAKALLAFDLVEGVSLNYSSVAAILAALLVMAVVLLSTLYPARLAARAAVPEMVRRWQPPPPEGDRWLFEFPFMVGQAEVLGLCGFLANYYQAYSEESIGEFYAEKVQVVSAEGVGGREYAVRLLLWLAPFDLGVSQYLQMEFDPSAVPGVYSVFIFIQRISGQDTFWQRANRRFVNALRKEFLLWHTLDAESKAYHLREAERLLAAGAGAEESAVKVQA